MSTNLNTAGTSPVILNYESLTMLKESIVSGDLIINGPIITAYASVAKALDGNVPCHVVSFNELLPSLLGDWDNTDCQFEQLLLIYRIIHDLLILSVDNREKKALYNNATEILLAIRELAMMGIPAEKIPSDTRYLVLFKEVYKQFSDSYNSDYYHHTYLDSLVAHKKMWAANLKETLVNAFPMFSEAQAVYLQGFCYITPRQSLFIQALVHAGYQVYFLNHHPKAKDIAFEIWEKNRHFDALKTKRIPCNMESDNAENTILGAREKVNFCSFTDIFSFVNYIKGQKSQAKIFCPLCNSTENMIDTFFSNKPTKDRLLSYPLGQYIYNIFSMWKSGQHITISTMRECIAAGWAESWTKSCIEAFDALSMFFYGCDSLIEWLQRIDELDGRLTRKWPYDDKHLKYIYLRSHQLQSMNLFKCMRSILGDFDKLLSKKNPTDALDSLKNIIDSRIDGKPENDPNVVVAQIFKNRLAHVSKDFIITDNESLVKSIQFFLGGEDRQYTDSDGEFLHALNDKGNRLEFHTIAELEIAQLDPEKPAIVAFCDADNMPGGTQKYPWPLTRDIMESIKNNISDENIRLLIDDFIFYRESFSLANRYRFYLANMSPGVIFTWVKYNGEKEVLPTPYFGLLTCSNANINYKEYPMRLKGPISNNKDSDNYNMPTIKHSIFYKCYPRLEIQFTDLAYTCVYKYFYGYANEFHMEYTTPMLLSHYISSLIYQVHNDEGYGKYQSNDICDNVLDFFPGLLSTERDNCKQYAPRKAPFFFRLDVLHNYEIQGYTEIDRCIYCQHKDYCLKRINLRREEG